jgi:hypothetical protein
MTPETYEAYKKARYNNTNLASWGIPSQTPENALRWSKSLREQADDPDWADWDPEFLRGTSVSYGPYCNNEVVFSQPLPPWLQTAAVEEDWDSAHLGVRVVLSNDEWFSYPINAAQEQGFDVQKAEEYQSGTYIGFDNIERDLELDRPERHSVLVDYSGPRDRSDYRWLTYEDDLCLDRALRGMAKGPRVQVEFAERVANAEQMAEYLRDCCSDDIRPYSVVVEVLWRGDVVGMASLGCCEMTYEQATGEVLMDCIRGNCLLDEAWDEAKQWAEDAVEIAKQWAEDAVEIAKQQAARIVEETSLLPEASHKAVRRSMDARRLDMNKKETA